MSSPAPTPLPLQCLGFTLLPPPDAWVPGGPLALGVPTLGKR